MVTRAGRRAMTVIGILHDSREDAAYYQSLSGKGLPKVWPLFCLLNPSLRMPLLARVVAGSSGPAAMILRSILIWLHACDVGPGASIAGGVYFPHPHGIVIGKDAVIESEVWIFQNVTIGYDGVTGYPHILEGVRVYSGACVVGGGPVPKGTRVRANSLFLVSECHASE